MNPFAERYSTLSNPDLIKIIDIPLDYQAGAVEAAEHELAGRHLSEQELIIAKAENEAGKQERQIRWERNKAYKEKVKNIGFSIAEIINPIQTSTTSADKTINRISILFGILFLFQTSAQFGWMLFIFTHKSAKWDFSVVLYLFLPIAVFLFWRSKKLGWILFSIFLMYSALITFATFIMQLRTRDSGISAIDGLFQPTSPVTYIVRLFIYSGCLWLICKNNIREIYTINKQTLFITGGVGLIITVISIWG